MAGNTITTDAKRSVTVMTGSTRFTVCHRLHRDMVAIVFRFKNVGVAFLTAIHLGMNIVTEYRLTNGLGLDWNIASMARGTVTGNIKRSPPVMASAAGPALLHHFHTDRVAVSLLLEKPGVTFFTPGAMRTMPEANVANSFGIHGDFIDHSPNTTHSPTHTNGMKQGGWRNNEENNY